jgi:hypothetical protein
MKGSKWLPIPAVSDQNQLLPESRCVYIVLVPPQGLTWHMHMNSNKAKTNSLA